jgi:serine/threonine-protein kinase
MSKVSLPGGSLPRTGESVGRFRIERELARGGLGAVFIAQDARGERVALKVLLNPERGAGMERFRREAQLGMTLRHEGLCPVLQFGEHGGMAYLTMPLLEGAQPITDYAHARGLEARARAELLLQAIEAMHAAHEAEAIHRDLKPGNVLVTPEGRVKIVDFGLGKQAGQDRLTQTGQVLGTVHYMAPEQVKGEGVRADARCDIFALGVLLYELIADELPFADDSSVGVMRAILSREVPDLRDSLPDDLVGLGAVIRRARLARRGTAL